MQQIADEVVLDPQIAPVDVRDEGQLVHVLEHGAVAVVHDRAIRAAIGNAVDRGEVAALGHLLDREVELVAGDEIDRRALRKAFVRLHRDLGADEADLQRRIFIPKRLRDLHVGGEGGCRGVDDAEFVRPRLGDDLGQADARRRRVDQTAARHQRGRLGQPCRIPERTDLPPRLIARAGAAVEAVERGRVEEQRLHHRVGIASR